MGELYQKMERDLKLKNLSTRTQEHYLRCCCDFVRYHMKSPRELGDFDAALKTVRRSTPRQRRGRLSVWR